ncbi:MAG: short-chain dehydrogenase [Deltaproteobacteria bacterium RIFCSPLOWO2_12_FULL_40_28]|nr:MAG: short-chain dehydrogenase [Deltaproteobacteria bacterium RIFCSPHIGHO2_02_FULL_40_28]OGQ19772.1 MAG: short-chain dehydrogenase [Deltaproteobacteria bacterium RIFCSPHIGHO2_12_FULL_40_32]OGQ41049.1 MAG: short-chain dehydrogenase [Deltaproteobacteria bacterium RIFCSPLOWO2_02_FULL_40_36]OGQ54165.1 MAG: short-chain dehydrogenase [Deltaproteobacteria bacterium RIFCSPLOWO2_12_FULL_40_28]
MKKIAILGITSAIALEVARLYAKNGASLLIAGRDEQKLSLLKKDLTVFGASDVSSYAIDFAYLENHTSFVEWLWSQGELDCVLIAYGILGNQEDCEKKCELALEVLHVNFISVVSLLHRISQKMITQKSGNIAVISSVAGDRGRQSNFYYGASKGALNIFLQGLRNKLHPHGISVLTIKPGFVDTPMTAHLKKGFLFAASASVAKGIYRAIEKRKDQVYLPVFWGFIMFVIRIVPEKIFKKLKL